MLEFLNCPRPDGYSPAQLMFGRHMQSALLAATGAVEPVSLEVAEEARRKTHDAALPEIGNRRLKNSIKVVEVWVQNQITGAWDKDAVVLGEWNGGASFSLYFTDSEKVSWRIERFLRLKKSGGEIPESDEQRKIVPNVSSPLADRVSSPPFDSHPLRHSERIRQKNKVNKLDGTDVACQICKRSDDFPFRSGQYCNT